MSIMQQYAYIYGIPMQEVKEWVNNYALGKVPEYMEIEETKEERIESIKAYIQRMVDESLTTKIKLDIISEKIKSTSKQVDICPF